MQRHQTTLKNAIEFEGVGLHTGKETHVRIEPAEAGSGINFVRTTGPLTQTRGADKADAGWKKYLPNNK